MKTVQSPIPRNEKFILDEYAAHGQAPVLMPDGRPVSMELVRKIRTPRPFLTTKATS